MCVCVCVSHALAGRCIPWMYPPLLLSTAAVSGPDRERGEPETGSQREKKSELAALPLMHQELQTREDVCQVETL